MDNGEKGKDGSQMLAWVSGGTVWRNHSLRQVTERVHYKAWGAMGASTDATQNLSPRSQQPLHWVKDAADLTGHLTPPSPSARKGSGRSVVGQVRPIICQPLLGPTTPSMQPSACRGS